MNEVELNNEWVMVVEEGIEYWINEKYGNVAKLADGQYIAIVPKVVKLGCFDTLDKAKDVTINCKDDIDQLIEKYNDSLVKK